MPKHQHKPIITLRRRNRPQRIIRICLRRADDKTTNHQPCVPIARLSNVFYNVFGCDNCHLDCNNTIPKNDRRGKTP
jgi:hypothetical protein